MPTSPDSKKPPQWLALHFPHLALDEAGRGRQRHRRAPGPLAISDTLAGRKCIADHNRAAAEAGIQAGMPVGAALGLAGSLQITARDRHAEGRVLERLAACCYRYSSQVSIEQKRNTLLLEVAASQRLFGPAEILAERVTTDLQQLGYRPLSGIAPTPEAACLAARHGLHIEAAGDIGRCVGPLDLNSLPLEGATLRALQKAGLRTVAEVLRLPRKALVRRLGPAIGDYLDRVLGRRPDPRRSYRPPRSFSDGVDIAETTHTEGLLFPLKRLLQTLCAVLRAHDRGVASLDIHLLYEAGRQNISIHLQRPTRSEDHLVLLLRERLERLQLAAPVRRVGLHAATFLPCVTHQPDLLPTTGPGPHGDDGSTVLLERLRARLGSRCVQGLKGLEDHRPEYSWALCDPAGAAGGPALPHRPAWLLPQPRRCRIDRYHILAGPERIESGWWDGRDCRRDYFIVRDEAGSTLWVFHEYKPHPGWYLHGLFS